MLILLVAMYRKDAERSHDNISFWRPHFASILLPGNETPLSFTEIAQSTFNEILAKNYIMSTTILQDVLNHEFD